MKCGKFEFRTFRQASEAANRQNRNRRFDGHARHRTETYHCPMCGSFHLTGHNN